MKSDVKPLSEHGSSIGPSSAKGSMPQVSRQFAFERAWPYLVSIAVGAATAIAVWLRPPVFPDTVDAVLNSTVDVSAIAVGFVLTAASILVAVSSSWTLRRARESGAFDGMVAYAKSAVYGCLSLAVLSVWLRWFAPAWNLGLYSVFATIWATTAAFACASFIRFTRIFFLVLKYVAKDE